MFASSSNGDREYRASERLEPTADGASNAGPNELLGRDLLNSVLRQTAQSTAQEDAVTAGDLSALKEVAARHRGQPLVCQPVVVELVQAVLSEQFKPVVSSAESWQVMCAGIAQTLFDDPVSRERLDSLWSRLSEEIR